MSTVAKITKMILTAIIPNPSVHSFSYAKYLKSRNINTPIPAYKSTAVIIKMYFQI